MVANACLQFYGMVANMPAYNFMVWWTCLLTILWYGGYAWLQFYGMVDMPATILWYGGERHGRPKAATCSSAVSALQGRQTKPNSSHHYHQLQKRVFRNMLTDSKKMKFHQNLH